MDKLGAGPARRIRANEVVSRLYRSSRSPYTCLELSRADLLQMTFSMANIILYSVDRGLLILVSQAARLCE